MLKLVDARPFVLFLQTMESVESWITQIKHLHLHGSKSWPLQLTINNSSYWERYNLINTWLILANSMQIQFLFFGQFWSPPVLSAYYSPFSKYHRFLTLINAFLHGMGKIVSELWDHYHSILSEIFPKNGSITFLIAQILMRSDQSLCKFCHIPAWDVHNMGSIIVLSHSALAQFNPKMKFLRTFLRRKHSTWTLSIYIWPIFLSHSVWRLDTYAVAFWVVFVVIVVLHLHCVNRGYFYFLFWR